MAGKTNAAREAADRLVLNAVQDYLLAHGGDSTRDRSRSPAGDGRWVPLLEVFPRTAQGNADRQRVRRLHAAGKLAAWEVACYGDCVKAVACERVAEAEAEARSAHDRWYRETAPGVGGD